MPIMKPRGGLEPFRPGPPRVVKSSALESVAQDDVGAVVEVADVAVEQVDKRARIPRMLRRRDVDVAVALAVRRQAEVVDEAVSSARCLDEVDVVGGVRRRVLDGYLAADDA